MPTHDVRPPDLEMQVRIESYEGRVRLVYTLHSPTNAVAFSHHVVAGPSFRGSAENFQSYLLRKVEQLGESLDVDGSGLLSEIDRKLARLGQELWRELIPAEIRYAYRDIRRSVRSWMIVSDEPWIPWEILKPYDASRPEDVLDDDFLALRFELTRWLGGDKTPAHRIAVRHLAIFRTADDLSHAAQEASVLLEIAQSCQSFVEVAPPDVSAHEVLTSLEAVDFDLLHFIGHGTHSAAQPEESGIPFPDGSVLRPIDLDGALATRIGQRRPIVFLNACWAGQQGWSLTRLGGWAARWVGICGCGAFVAPMWPVRDKAALLFSRAFYAALAEGVTLGKAALEARRHLHAERPGDPSALAYTIYGHPHAGLDFRESSSPGTRLPAGREPRVRRFSRALPRRRPRMRWLRPAAVACGLALILHFAATPVVDRLFLLDQFPQATTSVRRSVPEKNAASKKPAHEPRQPAAAAANVKVGGLQFEIAGGQTNLNSALKEALRRAASPVSEEGISGWIISLRVDRPQITPHTQDGFAMEACRLSAEASAKRPGQRIDLGPINVVNSQFDGSQACEAAAGPLAEGVLSRFVAALGKKGES